MWCGYDGHMGGWGMAWMGLSTLVFLALITIGIILLVKYLNRDTTRGQQTHRSAEQLLAERYARGEIDEQEYQQRLAILRGTPPR